MPVDRQAVLDRLRAFDFSALFTQELGWDWYTAETKITVGKVDITLKGIAEKRGVHVFLCPPGPDGRIPDAALCAGIERQVAKLAREHLLIFADAARTEQVWLYPRRQPGRPVRLVPYRFEPAKANDLLFQKLASITFTLNDEEGLNLLGVVERLKDALDRDVVTKAFYQRFEKERAAFQEFLSGIPDENLERWYVAVMMNRLMFIYFLQEKGFLGGGDQRYLQNRLTACRGNYHRDVLCPLFFEGFALRETERSPAIRLLLGQVPYLNGGIFQRHEIETAHGHTITVPNEAFARLFLFFDGWRWHLDERPIASGKEINPEILGYIFEKFINQKQMGAYYTKEDITGYISRNTIIPYVLDAARAKCKVAFENAGGPTVWDHLRTDPDRYIYVPVRHGTVLPLPPEIERGVDTAAPGLLERRRQWNKPAPPEHALPTEIWREVVARRQRCAELRDTLSSRQSIIDTNSLITLNLDICQFAQDVIERCEGPDLLRAIWKAVSTVSVLDPTCGSGAFLFAAVNILEPLYEACLDRMEDLLKAEAARGDHAKLKTTPHGVPLLPHKKYEDFSLLLDRVAGHANRPYFVLKSIILNNLYGVDIMPEAVEICKLRLFLKLVAQVDPDLSKPNLGIEPLPDIDFNIRAGNTLVGFATEKQAEDVIRQDLLAYNTVWPEVKKEAQEIAEMFALFRQQQTELGGAVCAADKKRLRDKLAPLEDRLNAYLAETYAVKVDEPSRLVSRRPRRDASSTLSDWVRSHRPFHWFIEFYEIMAGGGFNAVIGNPPYVELTALKDYQVRGYQCFDSGNVYALVIEQCATLGNDNGRQGFIVPVSSVSTERYSSLQTMLRKRDDFFSAFDDRPARLFDGLEHIRLTIHLLGHKSPEPRLFSTRYNKWATEERHHLFGTLAYVEASPCLVPGTIPKLSVSYEHSVLQKLSSQRKQLCLFFATTSTHHVFYSRKVGYFVQILDFAPRVLDGEGNQRPPSEFKTITFSSDEAAKLALCVLNASLFYWFVTVFSDCRHVNKREVDAFPLNLTDLMTSTYKQELIELGTALMKDLRRNAVKRTMRFQHDTLTVECIYPKHSKPIIDEIDRLLAKHYGFTDEELDFIINYDIKYRMGRDGGDAEQE